ncbi:MAG: right-handed parallel beta-helix repeat-containing protein [Myxococcales bacterium]|nr:right-handed parallel beta-helix repeat-containing protein [Myxococcales bacterium]
MIGSLACGDSSSGSASSTTQGPTSTPDPTEGTAPSGPTGDPAATLTEDAPTSGTTAGPTGDPSSDPTGDPTGDPSSDPTTDPTTDPTDTDGPPPPPAGTCDVPAELVDTTSPDRVVGDGTPASCTEAALVAAVAAGGVITFDCGPDPVTITVTAQLKITSDTVLDGDARVTLSGGGTTRIINMDTGNYEALSPALTVQRLRFVDGKSSGTQIPLGTDVDGGGGAIFFVGGSVTAIDSVFEDNEAATLGPDVAGGAIYGIGLGGLTVVGCTFNNNRAANGGALGALGAALTIVNSTLSDNEATGHGANSVEMGMQVGQGGNGGAIVMDGEGRELTICGATVTGNRGNAFGGALFRTGYAGEPSVIDRSTFADNQIVEHDDDDEPSGAGGLYIQGTAVTLTNSTISGNRSRGSAGLWILGHGPQQATANLTNVTIAGNSTWPQRDFTMRGIGGGLVIGDNTVGTIINCTIADNDAQFASGIARVSPLTVRNTIVSNKADNVYTPLNCTGSMYASPPGAGDHNLQWPNGQQDDMDCTPGITRADPLLAPLADNGGPTQTLAPLPGSPALAAGTDCPPTDQRGTPRADPCTLGALEVR